MFKKSFFLFLFFSVFVVSNILAQVSIGAKVGGGPALSYLKYPIGHFVDQETIIGKTGGFRFRYLPKPEEYRKIGVAAGVIIEANFTQKGWKEIDKTILLDKTILKTPTDIMKTINYIELPFLTHIEIGRRRVRFDINIGPQVAYSIGSSEEYTTEGNDFALGYYRFPAKDDKRFEFAISGGTGIAIYGKKGIYHIEMRFTQSLTDMKDVRLEEEITWAKSQFLNLTFGYSILKWK